MTKKSPKTQAARESFIDAAHLAGAALAALIEHPACPQAVYDAVAEFDCRIFNDNPSVGISLRYSFPKRLIDMSNKRPAHK